MAGLLVVALVAGLALTWPFGGSTDAAGETCEGGTVVRVAADPQVAHLVDEVLTSAGSDDATCVPVRVTARRSSEVASEVSRRTGQGFSAPLPDIWVPDSSLWLAVARGTDVGTRRIVGQPRSVVTSPTVIAMRRDAAEDLGWPSEQPGWSTLTAAGAGLRVAMTDPSKDGPGLASLLGVQAAGSSAAGGAGAALAGFARTVSVPVLGDDDPLKSVASGDWDATPTTEQEVVAHNAGDGADGGDGGDGADDAELVAVYDASTPTAQDFPVVVLDADAAGGQPRATARAVAGLKAALLAPDAQERFAEAGFRTGEGRLADDLGPEQGVLRAAVSLPSPPSDDRVNGVLEAWSGLGRRGRVLVAIDESGSMAGRLPGSPLTKSDLAKRALTVAVGAVAPDSDMGLWSFTSSRGRDYDVLVPLGSVSGQVDGTTRRAALGRAVARLRPEVGGGTGLYDTTLAAFRSASDSYAYGRLNAVLVITDGQNEDPGSISLTGLLDSLRREYDGVRPVRIITIAYGADADVSVLQRIADVTGGATYRTVDAGDVGPLFAKALAEL
jgi:Ca-activated chloride channel family protein